MKKITKIGVVAIALLSGFNTVQAQSPNQWKTISNQKEYANRYIVPNIFVAYKLDLATLKSFLNSLPEDYTQAQVIQLPNPSGGFESFKVWKSSIMEAPLQQRYMDIQTFSGVSVDNPFRTIKMDYTMYGFHAMVLDEGQSYFIDPMDALSGDTDYQVYFKSDYAPANKEIHPCLVQDVQSPQGTFEESIGGSVSVPMAVHGTSKKTYRLALSCTGEYAVAATGSSSPTKAAVLAKMVTSMNRVNGIYEKEMSIKMNLIDNNDDVIYLNSLTDPFTANDDGYFLLDENHNNLQSVIGNANYDIGHIFSTGGGGIASLGSVCASTRKGQGVTGSPTPYGDSYDVDYVAHEMGHQFAANHTFNNCSGNENTSTAYEPGSGSTIMAYAGICMPLTLNLQNNSHDYFHPVSLLEISRFVNGTSFGGIGATCGVTSSSHPAISFSAPSASYNVPAATAYELEAPVATWSISTNLKYGWEQWDAGSVGSPENTGATRTTGPVFRSFPITSYNKRVRSFPRTDSVHRNKYTYLGERTPTVTRTLKGKALVKGIGGDGLGVWNISDNNISIFMTNTGSPFTVTLPNAGSEEWITNAYNNVTWNVSGTNAAPINAATVDIYLSKDGGLTYPHLLATNVPNSGTASVFVDYGMATTQARIKVKGYQNVFYDVSNLNFKIKEGPASIHNNITNQFSIFPNPAEDVLNIVNIHNQKNTNITITNVVGQVILTTPLAIDNAKIDLRLLNDGIYFITISTEDNKQYTSKFVKK